ncbi:hypothetical protein GALMADRAFT_80397 [Galerina marginata CBS 339.88]|uniref:Trichothecene 3-O-acetyltransferase-like N-terminal domain-containing protein n=1 Tax=Galerina marginata (strain CBS 339.88) TaxID=685588 RepID=A0A067SAG2_GALM3|nr:hypothetical protein GALMADRAFT_80397 [Galerina marginata CBS 339.88]
MATDINDTLDILGQQPFFLRMYTPMCLCFPVADPSSHPAIISTLTSGLERLSASFPWIAGQVVQEGLSEGNSGVFKIKPFEEIPHFVVKDLRDDPSIPTMEALRRNHFPLSDSIIAPSKIRPDEFTTACTPVLLLQANFISGGLLLTFLGQHNAMDIMGQDQVMHLFSKACRGEQFTEEELTSGNIFNHSYFVPPLDESYKPGSELDFLNLHASPPISDSTNIEPPRPPKVVLTNFAFSSTSLAALKSLATDTMTLPAGGYISTDDALTALIWKSVTRARLPRCDSTTESTLYRAVDVRDYMGISPTYTGHVQTGTYGTYAFQKLLEEPLGAVASHLRSALDPKTLVYKTRAFATFLGRSPNKMAIFFMMKLNLSAGLVLSSWVKVKSYELDFNLGLGIPEAVRRPHFDGLESMTVMMPKTPDGEIVVSIPLREEDMERLKADEEFMKYATHIG